MARVLLISANTATDPSPVYPLGMATVAGALKDRGHDVAQFDFLAAEKSEASLAGAIGEFSPTIVGISIRNIDNVDSTSSEEHWYLADIRKMVSVVREKTGVPVVLGGPGYSILPGPILDYVGGDYGIAGEGERALDALIQKLGAGEAVPRITFSREAPLSGESLGIPLYDPELVSFYLGHSGMVNIQSKRGCPHNCAYCTYPALEGKKLRVREPGAVVDDMARMKRDLGIESFFFTDSVFNDSTGHHMALVEEMLRRDLGVQWTAFFRPSNMGKEELRAMKRSGLYAMELGTDAASDSTLAGIAKGFSFEDVTAFNDLCIEEEMPAAHFVIFGGPGETPDTLEEGLVNMERLGKSVVFAFSGIRILPGTPLHGRAKAEGCVAEEDSMLMPVYYVSPDMDYDGMNARLTEAFRRKRNRIFPPSDGLMRMSAMSMFGFKGLLWDRMVDFSKPEKPDRYLKTGTGK